MPKNLTFRVIANPTTRANALISGDVDIAYVNGPDEQRIEADKRFIHKTTYTLTSDAILFNHLAGHPTADDAVRQAVMTVIDQNAWNQAAHNGQGVLTPTFVSPGGDCFDPDASKLLPTTSIGAAQKVLENAGWSLVSGKLMKDGKPLVIRITSFSATGAGPEYLAAQLAQLGVTPVLEVGDVSALTAKLANGDFDIATSTQNALTDNPAWAFQTYYGPPPPQGTNWGRTPNRPDMDQTLAAAISTSGTERCSQWRVLQEALLKNHDYLPVGAARYDWFSPNFEFTATATLFEPYSLRRVK
jgi:peptide/nickel transport system substrate-binding protein